MPEGWHDIEDFYYVAGNSRQRLPVEDEPTSIGTKSPIPLVRGGSVGVGTNTPLSVLWFIGTDKQQKDYVNKHGGDWMD